MKAFKIVCIVSYSLSLVLSAMCVISVFPSSLVGLQDNTKSLQAFLVLLFLASFYFLLFLISRRLRTSKR